MKNKPTAVPVSLRAVIQRINRHLKPDFKVLKKLRGERWINELGEYYTVNTRNNSVEDRNVDPESYAREDGLLKPYEKVVE